MWSLAWKLLRLEVFAGAPGLAERRDALAEKVRDLQRRAVLGWDTTDLVIAYDRAVLQNPADPLVHFTAARLFALRGEGERAEQAFAAGFALQPNFAAARFNYAAMQLQRGRTDEARASMDALRRFDAELPGLAKMDAALALRDGDEASAATLLQKHLRLRPEDAESWRTLASLQRRLGRDAEADESQRRAASVDAQ
jgi:protein O-GlcNAc transferase